MKSPNNAMNHVLNPYPSIISFFFHTREKLTALNLLLTQFEVDFHIVLWSDIDSEREVREKSLRSEIVIHALIVINF